MIRICFATPKQFRPRLARSGATRLELGGLGFASTTNLCAKKWSVCECARARALVCVSGGWLVVINLICAIERIARVFATSVCA